MAPTGRHCPCSARMTPAAWRNAVVASLWLVLVPSLAQGSCLPNAIAPEDRVDMSVGPLKMAYLNWEVAFILSDILKTILEERMGYNVVQAGVSPGYASTGPSIPILAGQDGVCSDVDNFANCDLENPTAHFVTDTWYNGQFTAESMPKSIRPTFAGEVGYNAGEDTYMRNIAIEQAKAVKPPLFIEYYATHNVDAYDTSQFLATQGEVQEWLTTNNISLAKCDRDEFGNAFTGWDFYVSISNDTALFTDDGVGFTSEGCIDNWVFTKPCRDLGDVSKCLAFITQGDGWGTRQKLQHAYFWNIPFALAVLPGSADYLKLNGELQTLFYTWYPQSDLDPSTITPMIVPPPNPEEHAEGIFRSGASTERPDTFFWQLLPLYAPDVASFLTAFTISDMQMTELMTYRAAGHTIDETVCYWVQQNEASWADWVPSETACFSGQGLVDANGTFVPTRTDHAAVDCQICTPGHKSEILQDELGTTFICVECPAGTNQPGSSATSCIECNMGTYSATPGAVSCSFCQVGRYGDAPGLSECHKCAGDLTTSALARTSVTECLCPADSFLPSGGGTGCVPCEEGMTCPVGSDSSNFALYMGQSSTASTAEEEALVAYPLLDTHYWTKREDPLSVYLCRDRDDECDDPVCPGGDAESCGGGRIGLGCSQCPDGYSKTKCGCEQCPDSLSFGTFFLLTLVLLSLSAIIYYFANDSVKTKGSNSLTYFIYCGMVFTTLQLLALLGQLSLPWPGGIKELFKGLSVLNLDAGSIKAGCSMGTDPFAQYSFRCAMPLMVLVAVAAGFLASRALTNFRPELVWHRNKTFNSIGTMFQTTFILMVVTSAMPLQCYSHPNGMSSLVSDPSVLCWEGGMHDKFLGLGFFALAAIVLPFAAVCVWASIVAPQKSQDVAFMQCFRFLLYRFRPECWWWGCVLIARQTLLAFASSAPADDPHSQATYIVITLGVYQLIQVKYWPWKNVELNILESVLNLFLMLLNVSVTAFIPVSKATGTHTAILWTLMFGLLMSAVGFFTLLVARTAKSKDLNAEFTTIPTSREQEMLRTLWWDLCQGCTSKGMGEVTGALKCMNGFDQANLMCSIKAWIAVDASFLASTDGDMKSPTRQMSGARIAALSPAAATASGVAEQSMKSPRSAEAEVDVVNDLPVMKEGEEPPQDNNTDTKEVEAGVSADTAV